MWLVQNSKAPPIYIANYRERTEEAGQREGWASQPSHSPGHGGAGSGGSLPPGQVSCLTPPGSIIKTKGRMYMPDTEMTSWFSFF